MHNYKTLIHNIQPVHHIVSKVMKVTHGWLWWEQRQQRAFLWSTPYKETSTFQNVKASHRILNHFLINLFRLVLLMILKYDNFPFWFQKLKYKEEIQIFGFFYLVTKISSNSIHCFFHWYMEFSTSGTINFANCKFYIWFLWLQMKLVSLKNFSFYVIPLLPSL